MVVLIPPDTKCVPVTSTHEARLLLGRKCRLASNFFDRLLIVSGFDIRESGFVRPSLTHSSLVSQTESTTTTTTVQVTLSITYLCDSESDLCYS